MKRSRHSGSTANRPTHHFWPENTGSHIFNIDHQKPSATEWTSCHTFKWGLSLWTAVIWLGSDSGLLDQTSWISDFNTSTSSVDRLARLSFHDKTLSAFSFPLFFCSTFRRRPARLHETSRFMSTSTLARPPRRLIMLSQRTCWACCSTCCAAPSAGHHHFVHSSLRPGLHN